MPKFTIAKGKTFARVLRWESAPIVYKPISNITQTAPAVVTATGHGIPNGWRVAITCVKGMTQINAATEPPKDKDYHTATVLTADTVEFNDINAACFKPYVSGGYLQYNTPVDLAGYSARMSIKDKVGGTELFRLDTTNTRILLDNTAKTITLTISATDTAALTFKKGVFDLEMESAGGVVTLLLSGDIVVADEVTTT